MQTVVKTGDESVAFKTFFNNKMSTKDLQVLVARTKTHCPPIPRPPPICLSNRMHALRCNRQPNQVPALGPANVEKLKKKGINTTVQLMGEYLMGDRDKTAFIKLLTEQETGAGIAEQCAPSLLRRKGSTRHRAQAHTDICACHVCSYALIVEEVFRGKTTDFGERVEPPAEEAGAAQA
jgi:hypothetical protein